MHGQRLNEWRGSAGRSPAAAYFRDLKRLEQAVILSGAREERMRFPGPKPKGSKRKRPLHSPGQRLQRPRDLGETGGGQGGQAAEGRPSYRTRLSSGLAR